MNSRSVPSPFCSTSFTVRPIGSVKRCSTCRHNRSTPLATAARSRNCGMSGCGPGDGAGGSGGGGNGRGDQPSGDGWQPWILLIAATLAANGFIRVPVGIAREKNQTREEAVEGIEDSGDWLIPTLTSLGFSVLLGFASGAAFKYIGRIIAAAIGVAFVSFQGLVLTHRKSELWGRVEKTLDVTGDGKFNRKDIEKTLDVTGDGKFNRKDIEKILDVTGDDEFDERDIRLIIKKIRTNALPVLVQGGPNTLGFAVGFALALARGLKVS